MINVLWAFLAALLLSVGFTPVARFVGLRWSITDHAGESTPSGEIKITKKTTPRTGGIAIFIASILPFVFLADFSTRSIGIVGGAVIIFYVMLLDDIYDLPWWVKFLGQIAAATCPILIGLRIAHITNIFGSGWISTDWLSVPLTYLWIVGLTNAMNFIDGLDGLASGITFIACIAAAIASASRGLVTPTILLATLAGATGGFLPFNFRPAKIILGDSGANLIGYLVSVATIWGTAKATTAAVIGVAFIGLAIPMFDVVFSSIRRVLKGQSPMRGDMDNIHYILIKKGWSETKVVLVFFAITALLSVAALSIILLR